MVKIQQNEIELVTRRGASQSRPVGMESISSIEPRRKAGLPTGDDDSRSLQERRDPFKADRSGNLTFSLDFYYTTGPLPGLFTYVRSYSILD